MTNVVWLVGAMILLFAMFWRFGPSVRPRFQDYVRHPGRLAVRNDAHFFREQDDDPRYIEREEDGKP